MFRRVNPALLNTTVLKSGLWCRRNNAPTFVIGADANGSGAGAVGSSQIDWADLWPGAGVVGATPVPSVLIVLSMRKISATTATGRSR